MDLRELSGRKSWAVRNLLDTNIVVLNIVINWRDSSLNCRRSGIVGLLSAREVRMVGFAAAECIGKKKRMSEWKRALICHTHPAHVCRHIWRSDIGGGSLVLLAQPAGSFYTEELVCWRSAGSRPKCGLSLLLMWLDKENKAHSAAVLLSLHCDEEFDGKHAGDAMGPYVIGNLLWGIYVV